MERHGPQPSPGAFAWGQEGKKTHESVTGRRGRGVRCRRGGRTGRPAFTVTSTLGVQYG